MGQVAATERFVRAVSGPEDDLRLDEACLLISARAGSDDVDGVVTNGLLGLDDLAASCPAASVDELRGHLFGRLGFRGDQRRYSDPRNSYLDQVVARRMGIPITLAVLTVEVGRRLGVDLDPVGMPGHFLVGDPSTGGYIDAFAGGRLLDERGCHRLFLELAGPEAAWSRDLLDPVGPHAVLARILANLRQSFAEANDLTNLDWVLELRVSIPGVPIQERSQRAAVLSALGRFDEAASELETLAGLEESGGTRHPSAGPLGPNNQAATNLAVELRHRAARLRARLN